MNNNINIDITHEYDNVNTFIYYLPISIFLIYTLDRVISSHSVFCARSLVFQRSRAIKYPKSPSTFSISEFVKFGSEVHCLCILLRRACGQAGVDLTSHCGAILEYILQFVIHDKAHAACKFSST